MEEADPDHQAAGDRVERGAEQRGQARMGRARALGQPVVVGVQRDVDRIGADRGVIEHDEGLRERVAGLAAGPARPPEPREGQVQRLAVADLAAPAQQSRALQDDRARHRAGGQERTRRAQAHAGAAGRPAWPRSRPPRRALSPGRRAARAVVDQPRRGAAARSSARRCRCARRGSRPGSARSSSSRSRGAGCPTRTARREAPK